MKRRVDLNALQTFAATVHAGSMAKAAVTLGIPKSTVSRHLAKIEAAMGLRLVRRAANGIEPTVEGQILFDRIADSIALLQSSSKTALTGLTTSECYESLKPLRIRSPQVFGRGFLPELFSAALQKFPSLRLDLTLTDRIFDPDDEAYDINFCVGIDVPHQLDAWQLGYLEAKLYASPSYLQRNPVTLPADLSRLNLITVPCAAEVPGSLLLTSERGETATPQSSPLVVVNDNETIAHLAEAGFGLGRLPAFFARRFVASGALMPVLPQWHVDRHRIVVAAKRGYRQPIVQSFIEFAATQLSRKLAAEAL